MQVAAEAAHEHPDGVWFVDLAALADPRLVVQAVASVLGIKEDGGRPLVESLLDALAEKRLLLILDTQRATNCN